MQKKVSLLIMFSIVFMLAIYQLQQEGNTNTLSKMSNSYLCCQYKLSDNSNKFVPLSIFNPKNPRDCSILENNVLWTILALIALLIAPIVIITFLSLKRRKTADIKLDLVTEKQMGEKALTVLGINFINLIWVGFALWFLQNVIFIPSIIIIFLIGKFGYAFGMNPSIYIILLKTLLNLDLIAGLSCAFGFLLAARSMKDKKQAIRTAILWFSWVGTALTYRIVIGRENNFYDYYYPEDIGIIGSVLFSISLTLLCLSAFFSAQILIENRLLKNEWYLISFGMINWLIGGLIGVVSIGVNLVEWENQWKWMNIVFLSYDLKFFLSPALGIIATVITLWNIRSVIHNAQVTLALTQHDLSKLREMGLSTSDFLEKISDDKTLTESIMAYEPNIDIIKALEGKAESYTFLVFADRRSRTSKKHLSAFARILQEKPEIDAIVFSDFQMKRFPRLHCSKWRIPPSLEVPYEFGLENLPTFFILNAEGKEVGKIIKNPAHESTIEEELLLLLELAQLRRSQVR